MRNMKPARGWVGMCALLCGLLSACGGGGGGGGNGGGGEAQTSGLVPAAPSPGAALHADAAALRPVRDQARWVYRGLHLQGGSPTPYTNTVTQVAGGGGFVERSDNAFDAGADDSQPVVVAGGTVSQRVTLHTVDGAPLQSFELVELRSPVRVDDQVVMLDKHLTDSGIDYDGDKTNDAMDIAVWSRVIGDETVTLRDRGSVAAVRVDFTITFRVQYSSDRRYSEVVRLLQSNWYAPGLGLVRTRVDVPAATGSTRDVIEETLVSWDGIDQGLGATQALAAVAPAGSVIAGSALPFPLAATVTDGSHAVVMTMIPGQPSAVGVALSQLDSRGRVLASAVYRYADFAGVTGLASAPRLLKVGNELRLLFFADAGLVMARLDITGQTLLDRAVVPLVSGTFGSPSGSDAYRAVATGSGFAVAWLEYGVYDEVLGWQAPSWIRWFDAAGVAQAPAQSLVPAVNPLAVYDWHLEASSTHVMATLAQAGAAGPHWLTRTYAASSAALDSAALAPLPAGGVCPQPVSNYQGRLQPVVGAAPTALLCRTDTGFGLVGLDAQGVAARQPDGTLAVTAPPSDWVQVNGQLLSASADAGVVVVDVAQFDKLWPGDASDSAFDRYAEWPATAQGSFDPARLRTLARVPASTLVAQTLLPLGNRVLVVGTDCSCETGKLQTLVVWR